MSEELDSFLSGDPREWVLGLPTYQRSPILQLLDAGSTFEDAALKLASATAANTFRFGSTPAVNSNETFLKRLKVEVRAYICGDSRYKAERDGLFGQKGHARMFIVSAIAVAIAPSLGVAAPVVAPLVALTIASLGKVTVNAWCAT